MGRMSFLIVLEKLILKIPLGIVKNGEFRDGLTPVFRATGIDRNNSLLCRFPLTIIRIAALIIDRFFKFGSTQSWARNKVRNSDLRLGYCHATVTLRSPS